MITSALKSLFAMMVAIGVVLGASVMGGAVVAQEADQADSAEEDRSKGGARPQARPDRGFPRPHERGGVRPHSGMGEKGPSIPREKWDALSQEDRDKLREALREVWTDPSVLGAREEVKNATQAYQRAVYEALQKKDPSLTKILDQATQSDDEPQQGGHPMREGARKAFSGALPISPISVAALEKLSPQQRRQIRDAERRARDTEAVKAARAKLDQLRQGDEERRSLRAAAIQEMRQALFDAMIEEDPALEPVLQSLRSEAPSMRDRDRKGGMRKPGGPRRSGGRQGP